MGRTRNEFDTAFSDDQEIALFEAQGQIIAYWRISPRNCEFNDWLTINLRPGTAYSVLLWILPTYRGRSIGPDLIRFGLARFAREGFQRCVFHVDALNRNSFRAIDKAVGTSILGRLIIIGVLGLVFFKYGSITRFGFWNSQNRVAIEFG